MTTEAEAFAAAMVAAMASQTNNNNTSNQLSVKLKLSDYILQSTKEDMEFYTWVANIESCVTSGGAKEGTLIVNYIKNHSGRDFNCGSVPKWQTESTSAHAHPLAAMSLTEQCSALEFEKYDTLAKLFSLNEDGWPQGDKIMQYDLKLYEMLKPAVKGPYSSCVSNVSTPSFILAMLSLIKHHSMSYLKETMDALEGVNSLEFKGDPKTYHTDCMEAFNAVYTSKMTLEHMLMAKAMEGFGPEQSQVRFWLAQKINTPDAVTKGTLNSLLHEACSQMDNFESTSINSVDHCKNPCCGVHG